MNRITKKIGTGLSRSARFLSRLSRGALTTLAVASLVFTAASARATCGSLSGMAPGKAALKLPMMAPAESDGLSRGSNHSIVGLWAVVYTAGDGSLFNLTFDQWHSDGTEFESAYLPVAGGNVCVGVWKLTGPKTVRLHHIGWNFDATTSATANGTFTLDENIAVSGDGQSYSGTFEFKAFDINGGQQADITGTIAATRITVD
jgi:hypothetical protein